jgi:hypothetical protein
MDFEILRAVLTLASRVGGLGAKTQFGCGVFQLGEPSKNFDVFGQWLATLKRDAAVNTDLPTLQSLFWTEIECPDRKSNDQTPFLLRYRIREQFRRKQAEIDGRRTDPERALRHLVCGWVPNSNIDELARGGGDRSGSLFSVSFPYRRQGDSASHVRIWGWHPKQVLRDDLTSRIVAGMNQCLTSDLHQNGQTIEIKSFDIARDRPLEPDQLKEILQGGAA